MIQSQKGLSVLEVLFSLAIMSVIFAIVINYYYKQNKFYVEVSKAATQIQQLASLSYEWQTAQSQTDFSGISLTTLQNAGLLPEKDKYSQIDPWGGMIDISKDDDDSKYVKITLAKVPKEQCANLMNRMAQTAHRQGCADGGYFISI